MPPKHNSFTTKYNRITNVLKNQLHIHLPFDSTKIKGDINPDVLHAKRYTAIWDTGATNSVISSKVVSDLSLVPVGARQVHTPNDVRLCNEYLISVFLPNKVYISLHRVVEAIIGGGADVLIGMDFMNGGDFSVTNYQGKTAFSFRMPSLHTVDYVNQLPGAQQPIKSRKIGRNELCPCGSGKKYKNCHGK